MSIKGRATPRLVIIEGKDKGKVITIEDGKIVIGRSKGDVIVPDPRISRSHLEIHFDSSTGKLSYSDLKSLNGTLVNGKLKESGDLVDGDRIQLGNTTFDCQVVVQEVSVTAPVPAPEKSEVEERTDGVGPLPLPPNLGRREPELGDFAAKPMRPEPNQLSGDEASDQLTGSISILRKFHVRMSPRSRKIYAACALVMVLIIGYYSLRGGGGKVGSSDQPRDVSSIKRLQSEGKIEEALSAAESAAKVSNQDPELFNLMGDLYLEQRKYSKAVEAFKSSLDLNATQGVTLAKLARCYLLLDHVDEAGVVDKELEQLIIEGPHSRDFLVEVARLYLDFDSLRVPPEKMIILGQALQNKFAPDDPSGYKLEAKGHILKHNSPSAIKILDDAKNRFPGDDQFYLFSVLARVEVGDFEKADGIIEEWMQKFPRATQPLLFLAEESIAKKEYLAAMKNLQRIVQMGANRPPEDPTLRIAYNRMGKIYALNGQAQDAQEAMRRSCEMGFRASCDDEILNGRAATPSPSVLPRGTSAAPPSVAAPAKDNP